MAQTARTGRPFRARYCLAAMAAGWACSWFAFRADGDVQRLIGQCLDSPGLPGYALLLAWAGPLLSAAAALRAVRLAALTQRETSRPISAGGCLLFVALPAALLLGAFQYAVLQDARGHDGPQRSPCEGAPPAAGWADRNLPDRQRV
ncbi:hypothetical protein Kpho02_27960 [Kitasatospora phosalacinea]|uniref:Uncharacterized protein n=1 Tax=Kitasatospora phosalacinea TaxID=2065 RepID=A0A9W6Q9F9_9ACTN|nr:hypothetical protein [Kitasatospora phosalacinea]GLW70497.1 hypothetical protein Kpho02_27960 [Kitasatospora phosalacinea]